MPGTDSARRGFWSPDGRSLAFFADGKLKKIELPDGPAVTICNDAGIYSHGTWGEGGVILLGRANGTSIDAVLASGGTPVPILTRNQSKHEVRVHWPWVLLG